MVDQLTTLAPDSPVDLTPVSDADDEHQENFFFHLIEYPIVPDAQAIKFLFAFDPFDTWRVRFFGERIDPLLYSTSH